jgi:hypothetical protein
MRLMTSDRASGRSVFPSRVPLSRTALGAGRYRANQLQRLEARWRALERSSRASADPTTALAETVAGIWWILEQAASAQGLDVARGGIRAVLARRQLVRRGTRALSRVIRRGVAAGAFRPACPAWAIRRLPFAIVSGACVHWVFGLATRPSLRATTAVGAALELLRPRGRRPVALVPGGDAGSAGSVGR